MQIITGAVLKRKVLKAVGRGASGRFFSEILFQPQAKTEEHERFITVAAALSVCHAAPMWKTRFEVCVENRRVDCMAVTKYGHTIAYEIKVSYLDFRSEIKNPDKRKPAMKVCNQFYFAVPALLIDAEEVPDDCGLIWVENCGRIRIAKEAPLLR
jgi:hypothetical protein